MADRWFCSEPGVNILQQKNVHELKKDSNWHFFSYFQLKVGVKRIIFKSYLAKYSHRSPNSNNLTWWNILWPFISHLWHVPPTVTLARFRHVIGGSVIMQPIRTPDETPGPSDTGMLWSWWAARKCRLVALSPPAWPITNQTKRATNLHHRLILFVL